MAPSKTVFPSVPRLRLRDGSLDWPAIALRNSECAAQVADMHRQGIYEPAYQAQLQANAQYLSTQADAAWDLFFKRLPTAPRSFKERSDMGDHFMKYARRVNTLATSGALSKPATQRLRAHMQRWQERAVAPITPSPHRDASEAIRPEASRPHSISSSPPDRLGLGLSHSDGSKHADGSKSK